MKKVLVLAMCITALFLTACKSQTLTVELEANPTTGYCWSYEMDVQDVLVEQKQEYVEANKDLMGAGGVQRYVFGAKNDGTVVITFTYKRPWEKAQSYTVSQRTFTVKNGEIISGAVVETKVD
ncbi:MAG: protease inhibitor I42 family protein [Oscillospiraceae bacterium]|nr:protease inhibitor I42 family protein [Oscillospiraceae bacterium]